MFCEGYSARSKRALPLVLLLHAALNVTAAAQPPDQRLNPRLNGQTTTERNLSLQQADGNVILAAKGATRRQLLARLFADREVKIEWRNDVFADEKLYGTFSGTAAQVARTLLSGRTYIITYKLTNGTPPQVLRIDIPGPHPPSVSGRRTPEHSATPVNKQKVEASVSAASGTVVLELEDGENLMLLANGIPRQQVLRRLFADQEITIQWHNKGFADENIRGQFRGTRAHITRTLLALGSYVIEYDTLSERLRIVRIIVVGINAPTARTLVANFVQGSGGWASSR
jgi:hypothetical protein